MNKADTRPLVSGILGGDASMEVELIRRYRRSVLRLLGFLTHDHARAEDLTQETLLIVLLKLREGQVEHPERLSSFVYQTARFCWLGWHRQNLRYDYRGDMNDHLDESAIEQSLIQAERRESVARLIENTHVPRDRELLYRSYVCDESKPLVCEALALTPVHFDRVISRAKARLKAQILARPADAESLIAD